MAKVPTVGFNLLEYAKMQNLRLTASATLKDGSQLKFFKGNMSNGSQRVDCFLLNKDREIIGGKGAMGTGKHVQDTIMRLFENLKDNIVSVSRYVK